jgi:hypothetical protein
VSKPKKNIRDIIAVAKPAERSVVLCLRGDLNSQVEEADRELQQEITAPENQTLAGSPRVRELADLIESLRTQMRKSAATFTFRAIHPKAWSDLVAAHPSRKDKPEAFNTQTLPAAAIAACGIDPVMTPADVEDLLAVLNSGQRDDLFEAAWRVNTKSLDIPFSVAASQVLADTEPS